MKIQTAKSINNYYKNNENLNVSTKTIRRIFRREGLIARIKTKKLFLKPEHKKRRLEFARKFENWAIEDWNRVTIGSKKKYPTKNRL